MTKNTKVLDFNAKRLESIEQKRRNFERVVFKEFLGVYSVIDNHGSGYAVKLIDISKDGCLFQIPYSTKGKNQFKPGSEVALKLFFTKNTYVTAMVKVRHHSDYIDSNGEKFLRLGGEFDTSLPSFKAVESFIQFIYSYAEFSCQDKGEGKVYFL